MPEARSASRPAAVVFDCDGVLIESVAAKSAAFVELFANHPEHAEAIADHHLTHLGISRFEKFRWIYRELLERELSDAQSEALGHRFSELVASVARTCPEVPGAGTTLTALHYSGIPLFVASGTPQAELEEVIAHRGWTELFAAIYGSPRTKPEMLSAIAATVDSAPSRLLFVGDGASDLEAARQAGSHFVWRETEAQRERFRDYEGARIGDLEDFVARLSELMPG